MLVANSYGFEQYRNVSDFMDTQIYTQVFVGSDHQSFDMLIDTGATTTWLNSRRCTDCLYNGAAFDERSSSTFKVDAKVKKTEEFDSGRVQGYDAYDTFCLSPDLCTAQDFQFLIVTQTTVGLTNVAAQGVLGFGLPRENKETNLVEEIHDNGDVFFRHFSLLIGTDEEQSLLTIGGYNPKIGVGNLTWHHVAESATSWELPLEKMIYSAGGGAHMLGIDHKVILDTGTSYIVMPDVERYTFLRDLQSMFNVYCYSGQSNIFMCYCPNQDYLHFPDLQFVIGAEVYTIPASSYVASHGNYATIKLLSNGQLDTWVLGLTFFENYYVAFDQEDRAIGMS